MQPKKRRGNLTVSLAEDQAHLEQANLQAERIEAV
jgi:hypothetical protein